MLNFQTGSFSTALEGLATAGLTELFFLKLEIDQNNYFGVGKVN